MTPSFSPELIRFLIGYLNCAKNDIVCDPFLGKGTTTIETKIHGLKGIGIEINPLLKLASEYALTWEIDITKLVQHYTDFKRKSSKLSLDFKSYSLEEALKETELSIPVIHNVFRWWKKDVLKELLILKKSVYEINIDKYKKLYWLALCSSALDCANIHRNHPTITFDDKNNRVTNVLEDFEENMQNIILDLKITNESKNRFGATKIYTGDSTKISDFVETPIDVVITSPPYPNRFSYVHTTRPQLFFMDVFNDASQSADLDCLAIGGTWGKATSILYKDIIEPNENIKDILKPIENELRARSNLMCNYAVKYFNMMDDHIRSLKKIASRCFRGAYIIGNSRLSNVEIHTDIILAKMFIKAGFRLDEILILRKRGGKKKLYETAVCVSA